MPSYMSLDCMMTVSPFVNNTSFQTFAHERVDLLRLAEKNVLILVVVGLIAFFAVTGMVSFILFSRFN